MSEFQLLLWVVAAMQAVTVGVLVMALSIGRRKFGASSTTLRSLNNAKLSPKLSDHTCVARNFAMITGH
jgi:hypothetical protein